MRTLAIVAFLLTFAAQTNGEPVPKGEVKMPLREWDEMAAELLPDPYLNQAPIQAAHIERHIEGRFQKGLFRGTLTDRFEVHDESGYVQVPILDAEVSLGQVLVFGKGTSLFKADEMYTLGVDQPGIYEVKLEFFWGEDNDRFARGLRFRLPEGGVTTISVVVPETDIEPLFTAGVMTKKETRGGETLVEGRLDASGTVDLSWTRKLTHRTDRAVSMEAVLNTIFTFQEAVVSGLSLFDYTMREGETDAVEILLPEGVEVVKVEGDTVLQWAQESKAGGRLTVLLRHLVSDQMRFFVQYQMPLEIEKPVLLKTPLPLSDVPFSGNAGVQGPLGLNIQIAAIEGAKEMPVRDLPSDLTDLTENPLRFGFAFSTAPKVSVTVTKHAEIELTSTVIEEIQASTIQISDGTRITKMKFRIRNNTRETMTVTFPKGAVLTHALLEGGAVRPALSPDGSDNVLLFPLRQSERLVEGEPRVHMVRQGETFSDIANFYFSDPAAWEEILKANPGASASGLFPGQTLMIPAPAGSRFEESTFVLELAYKEHTKPLGSGGRIELNLPQLDVDAMQILWHIYFPDTLDALHVDSNLVQYSSIRYDPFRRVQDFIEQALRVRNAWAGGDYKNILKSRKAIYATENEDRSMNQAVRSTFPLVGRLYKFKRVLLQKDTPKITLVYAARFYGTIAVYFALLVGFWMVWTLLSHYRDVRYWAGFALVSVLMLVLSHYFIGMHRRLLWGADLALIIALWKNNGAQTLAAIKERLFAPWRLIPLFTFRNLLFLTGVLFVLVIMLLFPLLVSSVGFAVLLSKWIKNHAAAKEVNHV